MLGNQTLSGFRAILAIQSCLRELLQKADNLRRCRDAQLDSHQFVCTARHTDGYIMPLLRYSSLGFLDLAFTCLELCADRRTWPWRPCRLWLRPERAPKRWLNRMKCPPSRSLALTGGPGESSIVRRGICSPFRPAGAGTCGWGGRGDRNVPPPLFPAPLPGAGFPQRQRSWPRLWWPRPRPGWPPRSRTPHAGGQAAGPHPLR